MKIVALTSGGIDSTLMIYLLKNDLYEVFPLYINYGHLAERKEWEALTKVCSFLSLTPFRMDVEGFGKLPSGLTDATLDIYKDAFLPTRNLLFLTLASAYAFSIDCDIVAIGLLANPIFPDQTKEFIEKAQISISTSLGRKIEILSPLIDLDKRDIIKLASKYNIPQITYYCHSGTEVPCGRCISCKERIAAELNLKK